MSNPSDGACWVAVAPSDPKWAAFPRWKKRACLLDGEVYVPATAAGEPENRVVLRAAFDGVGLVVDGGHAYIPATWAKREFPREADVISLIESQVRKCLKGATP
jgi:hypothetical protein